MVAPLVGPAALMGGGMALGGLGNLFSGGAAAKEQKKMRQFLMQVYQNYLNDPAYKASRDFAMQILTTGDYGGLFQGMYQSALARNRANLLNAKQEMQSAAARGGFLRGGQQEDLLGRAREKMFQADTQASLESAAQQFGAKQSAAQLAESLAKGPFSAGMTVGTQGFNPQLAAATSPWGTIGQMGSQAANLGGLLYGQQMQSQQMKDLFNTWAPQAPLYGR